MLSPPLSADAVLPQPLRVAAPGRGNVHGWAGGAGRVAPLQTGCHDRRQTTRLGPFDADQRGGSSLEGSTSCNRSRCAVRENRRENADTLILEHTCQCMLPADFTTT